jgi:hypothetical protein
VVVQRIHIPMTYYHRCGKCDQPIIAFQGYRDRCRCGEVILGPTLYYVGGEGYLIIGDEKWME